MRVLDRARAAFADIEASRHDRVERPAAPAPWHAVEAVNAESPPAPASQGIDTAFTASTAYPWRLLGDGEIYATAQAADRTGPLGLYLATGPAGRVPWVLAVATGTVEAESVYVYLLDLSAVDPAPLLAVLTDPDGDPIACHGAPALLARLGRWGWRPPPGRLADVEALAMRCSQPGECVSLDALALRYLRRRLPPVVPLAGPLTDGVLAPIAARAAAVRELDEVFHH